MKKLTQLINLNKKAAERISFHFRCTKYVYRGLERLSKEMGLTKNQVANFAIEYFIENVEALDDSKKEKA